MQLSSDVPLRHHRHHDRHQQSSEFDSSKKAYYVDDDNILLGKGKTEVVRDSSGKVLGSLADIAQEAEDLEVSLKRQMQELNRGRKQKEMEVSLYQLYAS